MPRPCTVRTLDTCAVNDTATVPSLISSGLLRRGRGLACGGLLVLLSACSGAAAASPAAKNESHSAAPATASSAAASLVPTPQIGAQATLPSIKLDPETGIAGATVSYEATGLPANQTLQLRWQTWDGSYDVTPTPETVQFNKRQFTETQVPLGTVQVDGSGHAAGQFTVPEDFGEVHNVLLTGADNHDLARGGFRELVNASFWPASGPVGTPIHVHVTGLAAKQFSGLTLAVRWDNAHTGLINGTSTHGTADAVIRAAGPVGRHELGLNAGGAPAYLNIAQSPYAFFYDSLPNKEDFRFTFTVTGDDGPPPDTLDWPDPARVAKLPADAPRTATAPLAATGVSASFDVAEGPILSKPALSVHGLRAGTAVDLEWLTARGNRVSGSGWALQPIHIASGVATADGSLSMPVTIPDDLGGWHSLQVVQANSVVAQAPYFVDRSIAQVSPKVVHEGDTVTVHLKGFGWTELDNGAAVTYDNSSVGYVCGFNSNGDVLLQLTATGGPGTHLIDLYPMVYQGRNDIKPWYLDPVLSYAEDFPGLQLGYRLPAYRLAITISA